MSARDVKATALSPDFNEKLVKFRGRTFRLRELSIGDYDAIVKQATDKVTDEVTGETTERLDSAKQSRLMLGKCLVDVSPPLGEAGIPGLGTRVIVHLNRIVNDLHYGEEKDELEAEDDKPNAPADDEEEGKGNDSQPAS